MSDSVNARATVPPKNAQRVRYGAIVARRLPIGKRKKTQWHWSRRLTALRR
jgi:hypothetical protein